MVDTPDVLLLLRACVASSLPIYLSPTDSLDTATELSFPPVPSLTSAPIAIPLSTLTRFIKDANAVDLRSVYFAWKQRDTPITEYIASAQALGVTHLGFIERLELVTYLEGGQEESDHIRPLRSGGAGGSAPGGAAGDFGDGDGSIGQDGSVVGGGIGSNGALGAKMSSFGGAGSGSLLVGKVRQTDPRLLEIYSYERVVTNRNIMLRGNKPTVCYFPFVLSNVAGC
jgi:parafibromin